MILLDSASLKNARLVNKYWKNLADQVHRDRDIRSKLNADIIKLQVSFLSLRVE